MSLRQRLEPSIGKEAAEEAAASECQACGSSGPVGFYTVDGVPSQTCVLLESRDESIDYPGGDILLGFCEECGFIQNTRFDPERVDYSKPTEESQAYSPRFTEFATGLAEELVRRYGLEGGSVIEIGCGKGDFLVLLAERGIGSGLGIDPGFLPERAVGGSASLSFERDWFGPDKTDLTADLVLTRHLMEHIPNVGEFLGWLRDSTARTEGAALFTEVPDVRRILAEGAFWDVFYEHCSYFTLGSLSRSIRATGMGVHWLGLGFDDQYLLAGGSMQDPPDPHPAEDRPEEIATLVESFAVKASAERRRWSDLIKDAQAKGDRVAVWGGGSKAVAFVSSTAASDVTVVDINPHKQGKWLPGIGVEVSPPEVLQSIRPGLVIAMNSIYTEEIRSDLDRMGIEPELLALS